MPHDEPAAGVLVDERERRAMRGAAAERGDQAGDQRGLARAELADERDRVAALHRPRQPLAGAHRRRGIAEDHASSCASRSSH